MTNTQKSTYNYFESAPVDNAGLDPVQGFDIEVWAQDTVTGAIALFGRFQTITLSVRDATETYLCLGERMPTYLNGEIQIAWVLEQGLVDINFLNRTFGLSSMTRSNHISRGPRFQISFDVSAAELDIWTETGSSGRTQNTNASDLFGTTNTINSDWQFQGGYGGGTTNRLNNVQVPTTVRTQGRIELQRCKVDSISMGAMSGRRAAALRWEGVAEGWVSSINTLQTYRATNLSNQVNDLPPTAYQGFDQTQIAGAAAQGNTGQEGVIFAPGTVTSSSNVAVPPTVVNLY